jgi:hypothetical protein
VKRLLLTAIGLFFVFMLFTSTLFSMIITTSTQGFTQLVDDDSHYFIQRASAQEEEIAGEEAAEEEETTPPPEESTEGASSFLLRGFIGSSLPSQGGGGIPTAGAENSHIVTGRFRVFANDSLVHRFIAEMNLAAIDGTAFNNITIEETAPHRFEVTESGNGTATTTATGSIPPVSSELRTRIYVNSNTPIIDNVPMTISIRGQVLAIEGIDIDETRITDAGQRNILSTIDGQSIYGIVSR